MGGQLPAGSPLPGAAKKHGAAGTKELPLDSQLHLEPSLAWALLSWRLTVACFLIALSTFFPAVGDVLRAGQHLDLRMHARRDSFVSRARLIASEAASGPYLIWSTLWRCLVPGLGVLAHFQALALAPGSAHLERAGQRLPGGEASENHSSSIVI